MYNYYIYNSIDVIFFTPNWIVSKGNNFNKNDPFHYF